MRTNLMDVWAADDVNVTTSSWENDGVPQMRVCLQDSTDGGSITLHMTREAALRMARAILQEAQAQDDATILDVLTDLYGDTAVIDLGAECVRIAE